MSSHQLVDCPICSKPVKELNINRHIDSGCESFTDDSPPPTQQNAPKSTQVASFFQTPAAKRTQSIATSTQALNGAALPKPTQTPITTTKRPLEDIKDEDTPQPLPKKSKNVNLEKAAPLAERMRPQSLDEVQGQELVGPKGILRSLIETDRVPSMVLWGGPGTGKTTIARLIAKTAGNRFVEINSTSSGVGECKKLFADARNELSLTGRRTIIFCDEIHRFSKSQQDVFLAPVESGVITLIGATTENPSFKVINALLSRCRTFTLAKLDDEHITSILKRALTLEPPTTPHAAELLEGNDYALLRYLASFADGDARTALNLLSLALDLAKDPEITVETVKENLTRTLVYDRQGDQHYDTISAFHKSVRGSNPDAALYYLARMLQSGEDPVYIARRMVVMASEDIGLADNTLLPLATAAYTAAKEIGMPECRINLGHAAVALAEAPKSTRSYRGLNAAYAALAEPGVAGLPIPIHLRNAPTRLMKELGYGKEYKYNPDYKNGRVNQEYFPEKLQGKVFLPENHLGDKVDPDLPPDMEQKQSQSADDDEEELKEWSAEDDEAVADGDEVDDIAGEEDGNGEERILNPDGDTEFNKNKEIATGVLEGGRENDTDIELGLLLPAPAVPLPPTSPSHNEYSAARLDKLARILEMKFSHSIQFNAVPEWSNNYISYSNLKKLIYSLEKRLHQANAIHEDVESSPLLAGDSEDPDKVFARALDHDLEKICSFYQLKELEIYGEVESLLQDEHEFEEETREQDGEHDAGPAARNGTLAKARKTSMFKGFSIGRRRRASTLSDHQEEPDSDDERTALTKSTSRDGNPYDMSASSNVDTSSRRRPSSSHDFDDQALDVLYNEGVTLKKRTVSLYVTLCELRSFIQLNKTGFGKVLKKYDKTLDRKLKDTYIEAKVDTAYPFQPETIDRLNANIEKIETAYADLVTKGDVDLARRELRLHLREHVVWERNTVWREMIGIERKAQAANMGLGQTMLGGIEDRGKARLQGDEELEATKEVVTPLGKYRCPRFLLSSTFYTLVAVIAVFFVLLFAPIMESPVEQNCLALVVLVSLLWATEAIPLFVTSLLVPFLVVVLRVVRSEAEPHHRLGSKAAATFIFSAMWSPVIMLLLGGFTIAAALSKHNIAKMMATFVLSKAGTKPRNVLITSMFVAMFASMWISNVAAPVLCFSIIQPILRNLPADSDMSKALLLGIALSSNMGGAASPIASPQNLIALQNMTPAPGWGVWFFVALPVCIISILMIWVLLLVTFRPGRNTTIVPIRPMKDKFTPTQWFISFVTVVTIILWCFSHQLEFIFGDMGVVAILPMVVFFGLGILNKEDFNNFLWTIIILAAGGLALGKAVNSSGLLRTIAVSITTRVEGLGLYSVLVVFAALIGVVATFISHTVAALIVLPLVQQVGEGMSDPHPNLLVMGSVLMASAAMGLPTSGFPNMTAIMMEEPNTGRRYLQVKHFITRGVPASILAYAVIISVGYGLMLAVGF
ncbi:SPX domain-containing protein, partial [Aureobasidium melanogenum]